MKDKNSKMKFRSNY